MKLLPDLIRDIVDGHDVQELEAIHELVFEHPDYHDKNRDDITAKIDRYFEEMCEKGEILRTFSGPFLLTEALKRRAATAK